MITCDLCGKPVDQRLYKEITVSNVAGGLRTFTWFFHICDECDKREILLTIKDTKSDRKIEYEFASQGQK